VVGVDQSAAMLARARVAAEDAGVKLELRQADVADLAFVATASVDLVFCAWVLQYVADVERVFRQVQRVLRPDATLVLSVPHPAGHLLRDEPRGRVAVGSPYDDREPRPRRLGAETVTEHQHTVSALVQGLRRANLVVDVLAEPGAVAPDDPAQAPRWEARWALAPSMLVLRAHKQGV
jgi:SAM-dependent methyltransferase